MKKISLEICCGTTCYVLGAASLMHIESLLDPAWASQVDVCLIPCMGMCSAENLGGAPYVRIDGEVVSRASIEKILKKLGELVKHA